MRLVRTTPQMMRVMRRTINKAAPKPIPTNITLPGEHKRNLNWNSLVIVSIYLYEISFIYGS